MSWGTLGSQQTLGVKGGLYRPASGQTIVLGAVSQPDRNATLTVSHHHIGKMSHNVALEAPARVRIAPPNRLSIDNLTGLVSGTISGSLGTYTVKGIVVPNADSSAPFDGAIHGFATSGPITGEFRINVID